jgi:hypothetical protein
MRKATKIYQSKLGLTKIKQNRSDLFTEIPEGDIWGFSDAV